MLQYDVVDNYVERRAPYRDQHLKLAQEADRRGEPLWRGPSPTQQMVPPWCSKATTSLWSSGSWQLTPT